MAHGPSLEGRASAARQKSVFLNLPYDARFRSLFLAYVAGTSAFGLIPRATLEIPGSARRLDRILALMESCQYSIHDMSRVQLDRRPPPTPRFNMPKSPSFEDSVAHHEGNAEVLCESAGTNVLRSRFCTALPAPQNSEPDKLTDTRDLN